MPQASVDSTNQSLQPSLDSLLLQLQAQRLEMMESASTAEKWNYFDGAPIAASNHWAPFVILFCLTLIGLVWLRYRKRLDMLTKALVNWKFAKQIIRYEKIHSHPANLLLLLAFNLMLALFLLFAFEPLQTLFRSNWKLYGILALSILIAFTIKIAVLKIAAFIFETQEWTEEYIFQITLFNKLSGVVLIPICTFFLYLKAIDGSYFLYSGVALVVLFLMLRIIRGIVISLQSTHSRFSIILYLCSLEILPWIMIGTIFNNSL